MSTVREQNAIAPFAQFLAATQISSPFTEICGESRDHAKPVTYLGITALIEPWILRRTDGVVCNNRYSENEVGKLNRRTWIIPNSVDPRFFEIEPTASRPPTVLCVGVISERKNQIAFTKAIAPLQAKLDFKVRFLGTASKGDHYSDSFIQIVHS